MIIKLLKYFPIILLLFLFNNCSENKSAKDEEKPNIILIVADDLGYGDLGCYGQEQIKTPNIDKLASMGIRFTDHYAGSTVCAPSRASLMTGFNTGNSQIKSNTEVKPMGQKPLKKGTVTIASQLKTAGYKTGLIGKWGLGGPGSDGEPNKQGFDYFFGYLCQRHAHNYYPEFLFRNQDTVRLNNVVDNNRLDGAGEAIEKNDYVPHRFNKEILSFIEKNKNDKFLLVYTPTIPHANNEAGERGMEIPNYGIYADKDWSDAQKGHAAMISLLDDDIGRIVNKLEELNLDKNTLIIFTSDNGPHKEGGYDPYFYNSNGGLRGIKRDLYEGGIRVPMIAYWYDRIKAGTQSDLASAFWDYLPTLTELSGAPSLASTDGISFLPELLGQDQKEHEYLYWEFHWWKEPKQAVRIGDFKAVKNSPNGKIEIYNLRIDQSEQKDVSQDHPELVERVKSIFSNYKLK